MRIQSDQTVNLILKISLGPGNRGANMSKGGRESGTTPANASADWPSLMMSAQHGDRDAYRQLLQDIAGYVRALVAQHLRDAPDVEDTV
jgi:hypothetical protein